MGGIKPQWQEALGDKTKSWAVDTFRPNISRSWLDGVVINDWLSPRFCLLGTEEDGRVVTQLLRRAHLPHLAASPSAQSETLCLLKFFLFSL